MAASGTCSSGGPTSSCTAPQPPSKLCGPGGTGDPAVLCKMRAHVTSVMRAGINPDSQSRYAASRTACYELSTMVEQSPLYRRARVVNMLSKKGHLGAPENSGRLDARTLAFFSNGARDGIPGLGPGSPPK
jgi:hypothetical protein